MGNLFRLAVFILALGTLAAGTGSLLLNEHRRDDTLKRALAIDSGYSGQLDINSKDTLALLRAQHVRTQRATLLFGGLALACVILVAVIPARPPRTPPATNPGDARTEIRGLETLARANMAQRMELDHEREARHRSEQDLHLQQVLANHALQDKIRLGRDLHDGLVQTLYATGLVLETASQRLASTPPAAAEAADLLTRAKSTLNAAIRETRGTIGELTPDALDEQSLGDAIHAILDHLDGGRLKEREVTLSAELPPLPALMRTEVLQIIRESASNALRHGGATRLEISLAPAPGDHLRLAIRDNGRGFDPAIATRGHGLDNLAARARNLGATLDIDTAPGLETSISVIIPQSPRHQTTA